MEPDTSSVDEEKVTNIDYDKLVQNKRDELAQLKEKAKADRAGKIARKKESLGQRDSQLKLNNDKTKEIMNLIYGYNKAGKNAKATTNIFKEIAIIMRGD